MVLAACLTEVGEQAFQAPGDRGVPFHLPGPAAFAGVLDELLFDLEPGPQPWDVLGGGDELGAGQVEVALARSFGGQAQAVPELEFGLEEVALEPVDGLVRKGSG